MSSACYFIDSRVADYQTLIDGLPQGAAYHLIDSQSDGLQQIAEALDGTTNLDAIHIFSSGNVGALFLGSTLLDASTISGYSSQLTDIGSTLTATGDILLYGSDVGANYKAFDFLGKLAQATGADVAASSDATGGLAGDWQLEVASGSIQAAAVQPTGYTGTLAPIDYDSYLAVGLKNADASGDYSWNGHTFQTRVDGALAAGDEINATRHDAHMDRYDVGNVEIGTQVSVYLGNSSGFDDFVQIERAGVIIAQNDDGGDGKQGLDAFVSWQYQAGDIIRVTSYGSTATGNYSLYVGTNSGDHAAVTAHTDANSAPTGEVIIDGTPTQGKVLEVSNTLHDLDGLGTVSYQWFAGGVAIQDATGTTLELTQGQVGQVITVTASYEDGRGNLESVASAATDPVENINDDPVGTLTIDHTAPAQGAILSAVAAVADADGLSAGGISYQWYADDGQGGGFSAIAGANTGTLELTQDQVGRQIQVVASYTDAFGFAETIVSDPTAAVSNVNDDPTGTVTIENTTDHEAALPKQGDTLQAVNTLQDIDGLGTLHYQWFTTEGDITNATNETLTLSQAEVGKEIGVRISYTDGGGYGESRASATTPPVENVNDPATGLVTITNTATGHTAPAEYDILTVSSDLQDLDGMAGATVTYQWLADGTEIAGQTGESLTLDQAWVGAQISVRADFNDALNHPESVLSAPTAPVANVNDQPTGTVTITGTPTQGETLSVSNTLDDGDGLGTISYQWLADNAAIENATGDTLLLTQDQVGRVISVRASYTDSGSTPEHVDSSGTDAVANVNDAPTGTVTIDNSSPQQGDTLTAVSTLEDIDGLGTLQYQWFADGQAITDATANTLTLGQDQVGQSITVTASYTDLGGYYESVDSNATDQVVNLNDAPVGAVTISGTPLQGETLTAGNTLTDPDGPAQLDISYQWLADGQDITDATGDTLTLTQDQVGKVISVRANYTDYYGTAETPVSAPTLAVANVNDPHTGGVSIIGTPTQNETLTATNDLADPDGMGNGVIQYQWLANGEAIQGQTAETLILDQTLVDKVISVHASFTDTFGGVESAVSDATDPVSNVNDGPTGGIVLDSDSDIAAPKQGDTLTASSATLGDLDGLGALSYQWLADGVDIQGETATTLTLGQTQVDKLISVRVTYTDGFGQDESVDSPATAQVANVNDLPVGTVTIEGIALEGEQLMASRSAFSDADGVPDPNAISYQWLADGTAIDGATNDFLLLTQAEVGKVITVTANYTDGYGAAESVTSLATAAVANVNDAPQGEVTISGTATQDQILTVSNTLTDQDGLNQISYQWYADDGQGGDPVAIAGATATTLQLTQDQVNKVISVTASYTDGQGTAESVTSSPTDAVVNINDPVQGKLLIGGDIGLDGTVAERGVLTADTSGLTDQDGLDTFSYNWYADGDRELSLGTESTLTLGQEHVGMTISLDVTYTDQLGGEESATSEATGMVANVNDLPTGEVTITSSADLAAPKQGDTLTASNTLGDLDGFDPDSVTYYWFADANLTEFATGASVVLSQNEVGSQISVKATYTDGQLTHESVVSTQTAAVANVNDEHTGEVTISGLEGSGEALQGAILTAVSTLDDIDGFDPNEVHYQWLADDVDIAGATATTLVLGQAQVGKAISVTASYIDGGLTAEHVDSTNQATTVQNVNDAPTGDVVISGRATLAQTLTASNTLADADGLGPIGYQWYADAGLGDGFVAIAGATATSLVLTEAEVGKFIKVTASYQDGFHYDESVSSTATTAVSDEVIRGTAGDDILTGTAGDDAIIGFAGNDTITGGAGADAQNGGEGSDLYIVAVAGDYTGDVIADTGTGVSDVDELRFTATTASTLTLAASTTGIESVVIGTGTLLGAPVTTGTVALNVDASAVVNGLTITGNSGANTLTGTAFDDRLDGGAGNDILIGGEGSDTYIVTATGDVVQDSGGAHDEVQSAVSYTLSGGAATVETLTLTGSATINATGNALDNTLTGNSGANTLDGGLGADSMSGGAGSDTYVVDNAGDQVIEASGQGTDLVRVAIAAEGGSYSLSDNVENATLVNSVAFDLNGNDLANILIGNEAANVLTGGAGADDLRGGGGDDTYRVNLTTAGALEDTVTEASNAGTDTLVLQGSYSGSTAVTVTLATTLENLDVHDTGSSLLNLTGNTVDNTLTGNDADNTLNGGAGADGMYGYGGNDTYVVDNQSDYVVESADGGTDLVKIGIGTAGGDFTLADNVENATLTNTVAFDLAGNALGNILIGNAAVNTLTGDDGNDRLDGGAGADSLDGGAGNDAYVVDNIGDTITDSSGTDTVEVKLTSGTYVLGDGLENLTLVGTSSISGTGNAADNTLIGNSGANTLNGGAGADNMTGGTGNDTYVVDNLGDRVHEDAGGGTADQVNVAISSAGGTYTLDANVEKATLTNTVAYNLTGNELANTLTGNAAANVLDGGTGGDGYGGLDTLIGGLGDDTYIVDLYTNGTTGTMRDTITENAGGGTDSVILRGSYTGATSTLTLAATLENLDASQTGLSNLNLTGNAANNILIGNAANNILAGGSGADTLTGGGGNDTFDFNALADSGITAGTRDTIMDFSAGDKIDLNTLDANTASAGTNENFTGFIASDATFSTAGQLRYESTDSTQGILYGNTDADADAEFSIQVVGVATLTISDIVA